MGQNASLSLAEGEPDLNLHLWVTDQCDSQPAPEGVRAPAMKPDKMEETLTCIICQDLLHDCVRCAHCVGHGGQTQCNWDPCALGSSGAGVRGLLAAGQVSVAI